MKTDNPPLPSGYSRVPAGKIANMVTCLEMLEPPPVPNTAATDGSLVLERWLSPALDAYRDLFRLVGQDWMWVSRLVMDEGALTGLLSDPLIEIYVLRDGARRIGLLELDFREPGQCELAFFGVVADSIGKGAGRLMMNSAIARAWSQPIRRFWVHTCNFDSPAALPFYRRSGFRPYAFLVEVTDDPRLTGQMPRNAAAHVPLINPMEG